MFLAQNFFTIYSACDSHRLRTSLQNGPNAYSIDTKNESRIDLMFSIPKTLPLFTKYLKTCIIVLPIVIDEASYESAREPFLVIVDFVQGRIFGLLGISEIQEGIFGRKKLGVQGIVADPALPAIIRF